MSTESQIRANRENAQHSTGPTTEAGKAASSQNNFRYGLTGNSFTVLDFEDQDEYDRVLCGLRFEHQPATMTESILVEKMAQSYWLRNRALYLQDQCSTNQELSLEEQQKQLALFLRYQTTHDRAFHRSLNDLLKLRSEKRKVEIGFESQKQRAALELRREAAEKRKQDDAALRQRAEDRKKELHPFAVLLAEARVDHQMVLTSNAKLTAHLAATAANRSLEVKEAA
jgi:glycogen debranching enzyme